MKTELSAVADQYARAVLELATAGGKDLEQSVLADLEVINKVIGSDPEFTIVLNHPAIAAEEKRKLLVDLFKGKVQDLSLRLLELLTDKRRLDLLPKLETQYRELLFAKENILTATLTSAEPLADEQTRQFESKLAQQFGKQLRLATKVDPSIIAGMILKVGDKVIDGSLSGKLRNLEKQLLSI